MAEEGSVKLLSLEDWNHFMQNVSQDLRSADEMDSRWVTVRLFLNRILLALCAAVFLVFVLLRFLPVAESVLVIVGMVVSLIVYLFPAVGRVREQTWFARPLVTVGMAAFVLILGTMDVSLMLQPARGGDLRIAHVDCDAVGRCGYNCIVTIEGHDVGDLGRGEQLSIYGPHVRLVGGSWSETPIAIVRVLEIAGPIALAQVLLIHESAGFDRTKRLDAGLRVAASPEFATDFLVPAFGDGYVYHGNVVYLRPGTMARLGDSLVTLEPQVRGQRVIDCLVGETELRVEEIGEEGVSVKTALVAGPSPQEGDIVWLERIHSTPGQ